MSKPQRDNRSKPLLVVCILLGITAVLCFADMFFVIGNIRDKSIAFLNIFVIAVSLLDALLRIGVVVLGLKLYSSNSANTSDLVNKCQSTAIAAAGLCIIDWIIDTLAESAVSSTDLLETVATVILIVIFYRIVGKMEHTTFWDGIRTSEHVEPYLAIGDVATELIIDQEDGLLRPATDDEKSDISVVTPEEYVRHVPVRLMHQVHRSLDNVKRSTCIQFGDTVIGNVFISTEVQRGAGFDAKEDIGFSYQFSNNHLYLVMDEEGPERAFLAQTLVDQYLEKSTALSLFPEMITMLSARVSDWIRTYEERLSKLETNLNGKLYKMPKGFTEYMTSTRHELSEIESFCRQTGDMLDDLTRVAEEGGYERAAHQSKVIARHLARLAEDAEDVREFAGEIRSGYQERMDARQNNVISMLTIVETVFTPLALVTGWYGMNFVNMPELTHPDAYFIVVGMLTFLITIEFAIFKRRRWF